ncbi:hypothetical protein C922_00044 [Plasmodium inui San Antonio 1]|uniref:FMR1-interacting protein 1 conserved domain-containing protein n=1 Tax=Plasmodium inui San Antonio 1 TaxID=1237626 RepID=W7AUU6_9APIC|nr:hypothetical protein C922_00044 [Plasmodium inui San Antonio 1]EUD69181.1 hypothetical protein C922_00044 [Plasmodium inui San Antonio 1]
MDAKMGERMSQDGENNNYEGHFGAANNYGKLCNREESQNMIPHVGGRVMARVHYSGIPPVREQGDVWFGAEEGAVQNGAGQNRPGRSIPGQSREASKWASPPCGHSPNWPMQNEGASYWRPRGSPHNNRLGRRPWSQAPGAQRQHCSSNNGWRNYHMGGCQSEQPGQPPQHAHGALAPDGNYLKNYFSSYGNGYADDGSGSGNCGYHYGGAPQKASESESARAYNGGMGAGRRGGAPRTVRSSGPSRKILPPPPSAYKQHRGVYHNGLHQMGSISDDNQDIENPYLESTNVVDNANRADGSQWMSHTMGDPYESRSLPHGEIPLMRGSYNIRKGNNCVGFPSTNSFIAPPYSNCAVRGTTHWKKSTEERYEEHCSSVKKPGEGKRQKVDFPIRSESKYVEMNAKKRNKTDDHNEDTVQDAIRPNGINVEMKRSKESSKFIFCHHCDVNIEADKLQEHNQSEHIKCPIDNCGQIYSLDDLDVHLLNHIKNDKDEVILNDSKEIEKWIQERKKNYPTREQIAINMKNNENGKRRERKKKPNCLIEELLFESYCSAVGRNIYLKNKWEKSIFVPLLTKLEQGSLHNNMYENSYYPLVGSPMGGKYYPTNMRRRPFKERQLIDSLNIHRKSPLLYQLMKKEIYLYEKKLIKCIQFITRSGFFDDSEGGAGGTDIHELG